MSRKIRFGLSLVLAVVLLAAPAAARTESSGTAHVAFDVPDAWQTSTQGQMVVVRPAAGGMALEVHYVNTAAEVRTGVAAFERLLLTRFQGAQYDGAARPVTQHGMVGSVRRGRAMSNGQPLRFFHGFLAHNTGGVYFLGFISGAGSMDNFQTLQQILDTIRPQP